MFVNERETVIGRSSHANHTFGSGFRTFRLVFQLEVIAQLVDVEEREVGAAAKEVAAYGRQQWSEHKARETFETYAVELLGRSRSAHMVGQWVAEAK